MNIPSEMPYFCRIVEAFPGTPLRGEIAYIAWLKPLAMDAWMTSEGILGATADGTPSRNACLRMISTTASLYNLCVTQSYGLVFEACLDVPLELRLKIITDALDLASLGPAEDEDGPARQHVLSGAETLRSACRVDRVHSS